MVSGFEPLTIFPKKLDLRGLTGFSIRLCKDLILIAGLIILKNKMKNVGNKAMLKILANDK